jgi:CDP-diacylglycerol--glycerol-3-phosphate 3-phosphatidyltransferase
VAHSEGEQPEQIKSPTAWLRWVTRDLVTTLARGFIWLGLGPDMLTFIGLGLATIAAILAWQGAYARAGVIYVLSAPFDAMDGAVARARGRATRFGALLDSTLDRYGEGFLLVGLAASLARNGQWIGVALAGLTMLGSLLVSYVRARSEGLGIENKVGLLTRLERFIVMGVALLSNQVVIGLGVMAILTHFTVLQRLWQAYRVTRSDISEGS